MVLIKFRQVIMPAPMYPNQRNPIRIDALESLTMFDGDQPIAGAMYDIGMALHERYPPIRAQVISQHVAYRQDGEETLHNFQEAIVWCIENQVAGIIIGGEFGGEATADTAAVDNEMTLRVGLEQGIIHELHIAQHLLLATLAGTFAESTVID